MSDSVHKRNGLSGFLAAAMLVLLGPTTEAAPRVTIPWLRDMQVTLYARRALQDDPALARFNLGVNVRDGIATVWGPIPNEEVGRKAVKTVEQVKGVLQVHSDLYPLGPRKDEDLAGLQFSADAPTKSESASPDPDSGRINNLTGRPAPVTPPVETPTPSLQSAVALLAPVAVHEAPIPAAAPTPAAVAAPAPALAPIPAPAPPPALSISPSLELIGSSIERVRQSDERFRPIAADLKDGTVTLRGGATRGEYVMAFAMAISQLPGVSRVVVQSSLP